MLKTLAALFLLLAANQQLWSQVFPREGSTVNYRRVGFSFPAQPKTVKYELEIANGKFESENDFGNKIINTTAAKTNKLIAEVPSFASEYTWRVVYTDAASKRTNGKMYHFRTGYSPNIDTNINHVRVLMHTEKYSDACIFLDGTRAMYDMDGHPVWYLPNIVNGMTDNTQIRDLKLTPEGTITFLLWDAKTPEVYEINYNGDVLWKAPNKGIVSGDSSEHFHHEFTRLGNGHYMTLGTEDLLTKAPVELNLNLPARPGEKARQTVLDTVYRTMPFGTLIEYDKHGKIVWSWKSSAYFKTSDIFYFGLANHLPEIDVHDNSFYFDEKAGVIYVSFKNISRIIKIKYPEGTVIKTYGEVFKPDAPEKGNGVFCDQHSCRISQKGYLYLYNNNICYPGNPPSEIVVLDEAASSSEELKKIWSYQCPVSIGHERAHPDLVARPETTTGGNVLELPDGSIFASECNPYGNLFIVNMDKELLWHALPEKKNPENRSWDPFPQYRASIAVDPIQIEKLVLGHEK